MAAIHRKDEPKVHQETQAALTPVTGAPKAADEAGSRGAPRYQPPGTGCSGGQETPELVLEAASTLLITQGLIAVTIDAVAERAGIAVDSVYRWWPSEEALVVDVLRREWIALARVLGCPTEFASTGVERTG